MVWDKERVQRPLTHLVQIEIVLLLGIWMFGENIYLGQRRAHDVIHNAAQLADLFDIIDLANFHDVVFVFEASRHASRADDESSCVGDDGLLKAYLGAVRKAGYHSRVLCPFFRETLLRGWIAVRILKTLDVANHPGRQSQSLHPAVQIDLHSWFVPVAGRQNHAILFCIDLQDGPDSGVDFCVQHHDVLLVSKGLKSQPCPKFH